MNMKFNPQQLLAYLGQRVHNIKMAQSGHTAKGVYAERQIRLASFPMGLTVAVTLNRPVSQAPAACLLLAATPEAVDDALYIENNHLWLLRRYQEALTEVEIDLLFQQQLVLAALLEPKKRKNSKHKQIPEKFA